MKKNKTLITVIAHILAWVCFLSLPYIFQPRARGGQPLTMSDNQLATFVCINAFLFGFYYLNSQVLIPRLFKPRKWLLYTASIIACFFLFMFAPKPLANSIAEPEDAATFYKSRNLPKPSAHEEKRFNKRRNITHYPSSYFAFVLVFAVGLAVTSIQEWLRSEDKKKEMEHEKLNTELSLLKSQINPHFFFNTLNNIYSLAIIKSDETASSILKLSAIMRYVLTETEQKFVPLSNEVEFLQNYVNLQSVRLTDKVRLTVAVQGEIEGKQIAPLLFIPFVENAFKYGVSTVDASEISIKLNTVGNTVYLFVQNSIVKGAKQSSINTGIGIANVKRRLALLYPGKHALTIDEKPNLYTANLEINIA